MPFVKKTTSKGSPLPDDSRKIFVGRANELSFLTEHILKPDDPAYNIISIYAPEQILLSKATVGSGAYISPDPTVALHKNIGSA